MATKNSQKSTTTVKQEREARRLEKVEAFKKQQARERRNRRIGLIGGIVGAVAAIALIVTAIVVTSQPKPTPESIEIEGLQTFANIDGSVHVEPNPVDYRADYGMNPPAGGNHHSAWLNCGIYTEPVPNENAVHALEHGAVWITYDPTLLSDSDIEKLRQTGPNTYMLVSPYVGLPAPVVASAWGFQVQLAGVDDERLDDFITKYWKAATAPEPGAPCTGGVDGPGRIG